MKARRRRASPARRRILWNAVKDFLIPVDELQLTQSCVYFLLLGDEPVYVGKSVSHASVRVRDHRRKPWVWDSARYLATPPGLEDDIESYFIRRLRPRYNMTSGRLTDLRIHHVVGYLRVQHQRAFAEVGLGMCRTFEEVGSPGTELEFAL